MSQTTPYPHLSDRDIYLLTPPGGQAGTFIVYLPLTGYATLADTPAVAALDAACASGEAPALPKARDILSHLDDPPRRVYLTPHSVDGMQSLMLLPNNICNFHCSYCYSAQGRSGKEITLEKLKSGLRYFLDPERAKGERLTISVLGGGEPLLSWGVLKPALEYAFRLNDKRGTRMPVSLVTNGSIASDDIIGFCLEHHVSLSVSFDILEDVQNAQRGSYDLVAGNINTFSKRGLDVALNTVITHHNVARMTEMIETMERTLPGVKKVSFKPIISDHYFSDTAARKRYYFTFVDNFFAAKKLAATKGIFLTCPYQNASMCLADRYCPGKFVITAEGTVSICHCVSSSQDVLHDRFVFGRINDDGTLSFDEAKFQDIQHHDRYRHERCRHCAANWHCAGGCYTDNCTMNADEREAYCDSMRYFLSRYIELS